MRTRSCSRWACELYSASACPCFNDLSWAHLFGTAAACICMSVLAASLCVALASAVAATASAGRYEQLQLQRSGLLSRVRAKALPRRRRRDRPGRVGATSRSPPAPAAVTASAVSFIPGTSLSVMRMMLVYRIRSEAGWMRSVHESEQVVEHAQRHR